MNVFGSCTGVVVWHGCRMLCMLSFIFIFMKWMHSRNKIQRHCGTSYVHGDVYAIRIIGEFLLFSLCNVNERMQLGKSKRETYLMNLFLSSHASSFSFLSFSLPLFPLLSVRPLLFSLSRSLFFLCVFSVSFECTSSPFLNISGYFYYFLLLLFFLSGSEQLTKSLTHSLCYYFF